MKKVVMINGSPRMDGNTATLLASVKRGALDVGCQVGEHVLFRMKFMACQSCFACRQQEECLIHDELTQLLEEIKTADAVVIGSPIYMMQVTGPVKNMYDRFFPLMDNQFKPRYGVKKLVAVYTQGMEDPHLYDSYFEYVSVMFPSYGFTLVEQLVGTGANDPEASDRDPALLERAYQAGRLLGK